MSVPISFDEKENVLQQNPPFQLNFFNFCNFFLFLSCIFFIFQNIMKHFFYESKTISFEFISSILHCNEIILRHLIEVKGCRACQLSRIDCSILDDHIRSINVLGACLNVNDDRVFWLLLWASLLEWRRWRVVIHWWHRLNKSIRKRRQGDLSTRSGDL